MQSLRWYRRRLCAMHPLELPQRLVSAAKLAYERRLAQDERVQRLSARLPFEASARLQAVPAIVDPKQVSDVYEAAPERAARLCKRADSILAHRIRLFEKVRYVGDPIDWHRDHAHGVSTSRQLSQRIDYRDFDEVGDCKLTWELNRHQHLVVLARAHVVCGDDRYAAEVVAQMDHWMRANPVLRGMNWKSPLELAIRLINWCWALNLIRDAACVTRALEQRALDMLRMHIALIARHYSYGSSANNHLIGEAAAVFIGVALLPPLRGAEALQRQSRRILEREIERQTYVDGGSGEQATGYLYFVAQFFYLAGKIGTWRQRPMSPRYWERLEAIFGHLFEWTRFDGRLPQFGDADDGYVLDLADDPLDPGAWLAAASMTFQREGWAQRFADHTEAACWIPGVPPTQHTIERSDERVWCVKPRAFPQSGFYFLQGSLHNDEGVRAVVSCGSLGYGSLAAHGHADALSITLDGFGERVLVDPGTYDYFAAPEWRAYFRGTLAHNTLLIDGCNQAEILGPFMWGRRGRSRCVVWERDPSRTRFVGEHEFRMRRERVVQRREIVLRASEGTLEINDRVLCGGTHELTMPLHFGRACRLSSLAGLRASLAVGERGTVELELDHRLRWTAAGSDRTPGPGWISTGYRRLHRAPALLGTCQFTDEIELHTSLQLRVADRHAHGNATRDRPGAEVDDSKAEAATLCAPL